MPRSLQIVFVEPWILMLEVLQPATQLADDVVQPLEKFSPVTPHFGPPKVLQD